MLDIKEKDNRSVYVCVHLQNSTEHMRNFHFVNNDRVSNAKTMEVHTDSQIIVYTSI